MHLIAEKDGVIKQDETALTGLNPNVITHTIANAGHSALITHSREVHEIVKRYCEYGETINAVA